MVFENRDGKHILRLKEDVYFDKKTDLYFLSNDEVYYYYKVFKKERRKRWFNSLLQVLFIDRYREL